jgi:hypothetical protein
MKAQKSLPTVKQRVRVSQNIYYVTRQVVATDLKMDYNQCF